MHLETLERPLDFSNSESVKMVAESVSNFARKEILPFVSQWDEQQWFPFELFQKMGEITS